MRGKELDIYTRECICELKFTLKWGARRIQKYRFPDIPLSTISYTLTMERKRVNSASLARTGTPRRPLHGTGKTAPKTALDRTARSLVPDLETAGRSYIFRDRTTAVWCGPAVLQTSKTS
ncbi:uncharacterized protein N7496_012770 [Penicillium cataractarum]|uniref:Uncharacterized protein n=1 Tax=Penicillium cataractarum TaxID=2100454 RepID=A0A9W9RDJ4_9EURO|nr:uncharacterized protein N7496_012770 [Penicillium cataractarum]KAJ5355558.1 hypothetical protein N7496_012770 [Penicillium cataractarum]